MKNTVTIVIAKCISWISKTFGLGAGETWAGEIALTISPNILTFLIKKITKGIVIVAGTNGKTTTAGMITRILEDAGYSVLHNASGANLLNGIVSAFFANYRNSHDYAVFEVDENALMSVISNIPAFAEASVGRQFPIKKPIVGGLI